MKEMYICKIELQPSVLYNVAIPKDNLSSSLHNLTAFIIQS